MTSKTTHKAKTVPKWKKEEVSDIKKLTTTYQTIAVLNLENLPTNLIQIIKRKLKDKIELKISKKRLIKRAFEESANPNVKKLLDYMDGAPALIFTNTDAFGLFRTLKQNREFVPIKPGQAAPEDIWVYAGPTPFTPGPILSELGSLKIKAGVEGGKIAIKSDSLIIKKGETASGLAASILSRLDIKPMQVGMTVTAVLEGDELYKAYVLDIDEEKLLSDIKTIVSDSLILSIELGIVNTETISHLISKAYRDVKALAISQNIFTPETPEVLAKIESAASALKTKVKE